MVSQNTNDLKKSVPLWFYYDETVQKAVLYWLNDPSAATYTVSSVNYVPATPVLTSIGTVASNVDSFVVSAFEKGKNYRYRVAKNAGVGFIDFGIEQPFVQQRGRCLLVLDDRFTTDLNEDINVWIKDIKGDGWLLDTVWVKKENSVISVKQKIVTWAKSNYTLSQAVILFGHIPVPYSGNTAIDGHQPDHVGAWPADVFYADINGVWTDNAVNVTTATRTENHNIPGDGKYDQVFLPSDADLEIGRIDFADLPAFSLSEKELLKKYLQKNHRWRTGLMSYPNAAVLENNFPGFDEGFGQNAWRNFIPMFGKNKVREADYENVLINEKNVFSFACGGGSYTSCGGIGTTQNLWVAKEIQSVFTMTFGSYFGDWDSQNNFLRSALASGDILTNTWAGRPNWLFYPMASGAHIGYCTRLTQNANTNIFSMGFGARYAHTALMGDPTLRLHPVLSVTNLQAIVSGDSVKVSWAKQDSSQNRFLVYYTENGDFNNFIEVTGTSHTFGCLTPGVTMQFMVRPLVLTHSASGSYYNAGTGESVSIPIVYGNAPVATFSTIKNFENVQFSNLSTNADKYLWDFGDGNSSTSAEPIHVFRNEGQYNVCLKVTKNECLEDVYCETITIASSLPTTIESFMVMPTCFDEVNGSIQIQLSGGSPNDLIYRWNNGASTQNLENIGAGIYRLTITSSITGDTIISPEFVIEQPEELIVNVEVTPSSGQNGTAVFNVFGGVQPYNFELFPSVSDITKLAPGIYTVTVTDANMCSKIVNFVVEMSSSTSFVVEKPEVFPNPAKDFVNVGFLKSDHSVSLIETNGRIVRIFSDAEKSNKILDIKDVAPGLYYLYIKGKQDEIYISTVVIIK
ncbi:MAG: T9SS type A sorting domain-containing protein [Saprospiraceae bacterium]|nr:T9SS type A sorting domain-containing protein [Saprospiraceae bacterium]